MRIGGIFASAAVAVLVGVGGPAHATAKPDVGAKQAYVVDSAGTIHYGKRQTKRVPVASLVKVMTAYVVLREARLTDTVTITAADVRHAVVNGATTAALRKGERVTVRDLLYGLMLPSGADASNALARAYGPGKKAFVDKMNDTAKALGLADTHYTNADGLPTPARGGYSTAADQVKLAQIALKNPVFTEVASAKVHKVAKSRSHRAHTWRNTNKLLERTDGVLGVKTGYTRAAGFCLVFAAERNGRQVVGVLLGDTNERRFAQAEKLLDYAEEQITAG
ncbi:D-alanyl-D-alanine carboxypeptidase family protein [Nonomuraea sp. NPDC050790]|uniref:D-alanyl-D-alanine carboxypeptidase family protein n=1 Tax=Nonomuraea sp. NPDC050790 TaxID=3364371 RepID=UPI003793F5A3